MANLPSRLRNLRKEKGMRQSDLASVFGVTDSTIAYWESGKRSMNTKNTIKLAEYFGVSMDYITGRADSREVLIYPEEIIDELRTLISTKIKKIPESGQKEIVEYIKLQLIKHCNRNR